MNSNTQQYDDYLSYHPEYRGYGHEYYEITTEVRHRGLILLVTDTERYQ